MRERNGVKVDLGKEVKEVRKVEKVKEELGVMINKKNKSM
jgi:hypothetical protein